MEKSREWINASRLFDWHFLMSVEEDDSYLVEENSSLIFDESNTRCVPCFDAIKHVKLYLLDRVISVSPIIGAGDIFKQEQKTFLSISLFRSFVRSFALSLSPYFVSTNR